LKIAAEILTGLWIAFMLYPQMDETTNGYSSLFNLFIFLIFYGFLMWGAWKKPWLGLVLVVLGIVSGLGSLRFLEWTTAKMGILWRSS